MIFIYQHILKLTMAIMGTTNNLETQANRRTTTTILRKPSKRLIPFSSQLENIWWSYIAKGTFSIHEAYHLELRHQSLPTNEVCVKIWNHHTWPNISFFLWLLISNISLTRDKIKKCNYQGPSRWNFKIIHLESIKHLFNISAFSSCLWAHRDNFFSHSNRYPLNITNTTSNWKKCAFSNPILNRIWKLFHSFLPYVIWKHNNQWISKGSSMPLDSLWNSSLTNIKETILALLFSPFD